MALNIGPSDSLLIQQQQHIDKRATEHDRRPVALENHAGPAAVFSFSQQALDSAKDSGRSQFGNRTQVSAPTPTDRATIDSGATPVETAAALPPAGEPAEARAARPDPALHDYWQTTSLATSTSTSSNGQVPRQVAYQDLLDNVRSSFEGYFS